MAPRIPLCVGCCFCMSLRTGAKIFGLMSLVSGLLVFMMTFSRIDSVINYHPEHSRWTLPQLITDLVIWTLHSVTSVLLLLGLYQSKRKFIPPWLVTSVLVAFADMYFQSTLSRLLIEEIAKPWPVAIFVTILSLVDDVYGFMIVFSYYWSLPPVETGVI